MTLKFVDRVLETSTTSGTGTLNLLGPVAGFRSFSAAGNGAKVGYVIDDGTLWEIGTGTVTTGSPNTLSRTTVYASSNSNALVSFGSNTKNVRLAPLAALVLGRDEKLNFTDLLGTAGGTANAHTVAMPVTSLGYTDGMLIMYRAPAANTSTTVNVNVDALGNKRLKINGADPLVGQIASSALIVGVYNLASDVVEIINSLSSAFLPLSGGNMTGAINEVKGTDLASAATVNIGAATGNYVAITGTTTITAFDTVQAGTKRKVRFSGALTLTHNATSLILPGGANITTAAGDMAEFISEGSGNWRCTDYQKADGTPLVAPTTALSAAFESAEQTITAGGNYSVAHGLGGMPKIFYTTIRCKTAEFGYSVGDEVPVSMADGNSANSNGTWANSTNVGYQSISGYTFLVPTRTSGGANNTITTANWKLVLRAFR